MQVNEKEREHDLTALRKEIATLVAEKCVDPATQRPYPVGLIEKGMAEAGFSVKQNKNAKSQVRSLVPPALFRYNSIDEGKQVSECIRMLQTSSNLPIQRARMRVRVTMPTADGKRLKEKMTEGAEKIEEDIMGQDEWEVVRSILPDYLQHYYACSHTGL